MQKKHLFASVLLVGALGFLVNSSLKAGTLKAIPVTELRAKDGASDSHIGQKLRAVGFVGAKAPQYKLRQTDNGAVKGVEFEIVEGKDTILVSYSDTLPDTFRAGGPVQVDGTYVAPGKIQADKVLTKCPSKYETGEDGKQKKEGAGYEKSAKTDSA